MVILVPAPNAHGWFLSVSDDPRKMPSAIEMSHVKAFVGQVKYEMPTSVREQLLIESGER